MVETIYYNTGLAHQNLDNYDKAYDYYRANLLVCIEIYGDDHVDTQHVKQKLDEEIYQTIAINRRDNLVIKT